MCIEGWSRKYLDNTMLKCFTTQKAKRIRENKLLGQINTGSIQKHGTLKPKHYVKKLVRALRFKTHRTKSHGTEIPCNLVPANVLHLRSAFGVPVILHWHLQQIAKTVCCERGMGNTQGMHLYRTTFRCETALNLSVHQSKLKNKRKKHIQCISPIHFFIFCPFKRAAYTKIYLSEIQ